MSRLVVLSNRIPTGDTPSGGLVVALHDALAERGGVWVGSSGTPVAAPEARLTEIGTKPYRRLAFDLGEDEHREFYLGYANSVLWPLFHQRPDLIDIQPDFAPAYRAVNRRVAKMLFSLLEKDDTLWVHDYHYFPIAQELRTLGFQGRIGFFLHIPFVTASNLRALPEADDLIEWIAAYDLFGLQTERDVGACLEVIRASERGQLLRSGEVKVGDNRCRVASFPIGIDAKVFARTAAEEHGAIDLRLPDDVRVVLGVDRLDYSKGLVNRFEAFNAYLDARNGDQPRATLIQITPPSREEVGAYQQIRRELEELSGSVNGAHSELDWTPIRYIRRAVSRDLLAGLYRRADVMLVTPLADGMNLVAKEFVAAQDPDDPGVLVLSHFAGAGEQLKEALSVNPYDVEEASHAIADALTMPLDERRRRHAALLDNVMTENVAWWTANFLRALDARAPADA